MLYQITEANRENSQWAQLRPWLSLSTREAAWQRLPTGLPHHPWVKASWVPSSIEANYLPAGLMLRADITISVTCEEAHPDKIGNAYLNLNFTWTIKINLYKYVPNIPWNILIIRNYLLFIWNSSWTVHLVFLFAKSGNSANEVDLSSYWTTGHWWLGCCSQSLL